MRRLFVIGAGLRWTITRNSLRRRGLPMFVLSLVFSGAAAVAGFVTFATMHGSSTVDRRAVLTFGYTLIAVAWVFGPLLIGGADETVDPSRLALLPLDGRQLAAVLTGAAVSTPPTIALGIALLGGVVAGWSGPLAAVVALVAMAALFVFGLGAARTVAALMGLANRSRRGRDLSVLVVALAGVTLWFGSQSIGPIMEASKNEHGNAIIDAMAWTPPGWAARAVLHARAGDPLAALPWVVALFATGLVLVASWARLTARLLVGSARHEAGRTRHERAIWARAHDGPSAALAKEWRYQWRSPMKRTQLVISTVMSVGFALLQVMRTGHAEIGPKAVFAGFLGLMFMAGNAFNIIGFDSPSLWLEFVAAGRVGRTQLRARSLAFSVSVAVPTVAAVAAVAAVSGEWSEVGLALALVPAAALCLLGVGVFVSAWVPLPMADGDNPFRRPSGANGCSYGASIMGALVSVSVLFAPILVPAIVGDGNWRYLLALSGAAWGYAIWSLGLRLGDRILLRRGPDLIAGLSNRAAV